MCSQNKKISDEIIHKELDMIQSCISRMSQNEFLIKGWYISLLAVTVVFKIQSIYLYGFLLFSLSACFYLLNMQFYIYENQYRDLYDERINLRIQKQLKDGLYSLKIMGLKKEEFYKYFLKGWVIFLFYLVIPSIFLTVIYFTTNNSNPIPNKIFIEIKGMLF